MKVYLGTRDVRGLTVRVRQRVDSILGPAQRTQPLRHYVKHSPTGFECGYEGSGPADLARCLLIDVFGDAGRWRVRLEPGWYQRFKSAIVAQLPQDASWELPEERIREWERYDCATKGIPPVVRLYDLGRDRVMHNAEYPTETWFDDKNITKDAKRAAEKLGAVR